MMLIPGQVQMAQMPDPPPAGGFHPISVKDGFVMICIVSPKNMRGLSEAMNRPDLLDDERFKFAQRGRYMNEFIAEIESWSLKLTALECEASLNQTGVPCSIYNAPHDLFAHPQVLARNTFKTLEDQHGDFFIQNAPFQFSNTDISTSRRVPMLGEDTNEILSEQLKLSTEEIADLHEAGVISSV